MTRHAPPRRFPRAALFALACFIALAASGCRRAIPELFPPKPGDRAIPLYVVSHGWHTGLVFRRGDVPASVDWPELSLFPEGEWLEIGWGDAGFYQAERITSGIATKAIFWPTPSVLHVVAFDAHPLDYFYGSGVVLVQLSEKGFAELAASVAEAFDRSGETSGVARSMGPGLYGRSQFYAAKGRYWLFRTCNHWTARTIRAAGCPITPFYGFTASNVMSQSEGFGERLAELDG